MFNGMKWDSCSEVKRYVPEEDKWFSKNLDIFNLSQFLKSVFIEENRGFQLQEKKWTKAISKWNSYFYFEVFIFSKRENLQWVIQELVLKLG